MPYPQFEDFMIALADSRDAAKAFLMRGAQPRQPGGDSGQDLVGPPGEREEPALLFLKSPARERAIFFPLTGKARQSDLEVAGSHLRRSVRFRYSV